MFPTLKAKPAEERSGVEKWADQERAESVVRKETPAEPPVVEWEDDSPGGMLRRLKSEAAGPEGK